MSNMSAHEAKVNQYISSIVATDNCTFFQGYPGSCKTRFWESQHTCNIIAKSLSQITGQLEIIRPVHVAINELATQEDATGYPMQKDKEFSIVKNDSLEKQVYKVMGKSMPEWLAEVLQNDQEGIWSLVNFDELNRTDAHIIQPLMGLLTSRVFCGVKIPRRVMFIATGNYGHKDGCNVSELDTAQQDRIMQFDWTMTFEEWCDSFAKHSDNYVIRCGKSETIILPEILAFIGQTPSVFTNQFHNARSWTKFSGMLDTRLKLCGESVSRKDAIMTELNFTGLKAMRNDTQGFADFKRFLDGYYKITFDDVIKDPQILETIGIEQLRMISAAMRNFLIEHIKKGVNFYDASPGSRLFSISKHTYNPIIQKIIGKMTDEEAIGLHTMLRQEGEKNSVTHIWTTKNALLFIEKSKAITEAERFQHEVKQKK